MLFCPGHTSDTIKGGANHTRSPFPFLRAGSKVRPADTKDNISLSNSGRLQQQTGIFPLSRALFDTCSSASFRRLFPGQLFLPPKPNGPRRIWLSTKFSHSHLQLFYDLLQLTAQGKTSSRAVIKLLDWKPSISTLSLFYFLSFNITWGNRTIQFQLLFIFK